MGTQYEIFEGWVKRFKEEVQKREVVQLTVKDLDTQAKSTVRAKLADDPADLSNPKPLRVVTDLGEKSMDMFIQVIEELEELESAALDA